VSVSIKVQFGIFTDIKSSATTMAATSTKVFLVLAIFAIIIMSECLTQAAPVEATTIDPFWKAVKEANRGAWNIIRKQVGLKPLIHSKFF
jgi:hypothetical protein